MTKKYQFDPEYYHISYSNYLARNAPPTETHNEIDLGGNIIYSERHPHIPPTYQPPGPDEINRVVAPEETPIKPRTEPMNNISATPVLEEVADSSGISKTNLMIIIGISLLITLFAIIGFIKAYNE